MNFIIFYTAVLAQYRAVLGFIIVSGMGISLMCASDVLCI